MGRVLAINHGADAVPAHGGARPVSQLAPSSAVLIPGNVAPASTCAGIKKDGGACMAPPAKGTELCAGHLRSAGRL